MNRRFSPLALVAALVLGVMFTGQPAHAEERIWVELQKQGRPTVNIPSLAPLVEKAGPACLVVTTEGDFSVPSASLPPGHPAPNLPPQGRRMGQGAGFLIHPEGYALTNFHVVEGADVIRVKVGTSNDEIAAVVVGKDQRTDVALIRLKSGRKDWPVIPLGDSDELSVGDFLVAIGNPFGLDQTVSLGILSAKGRRDVAPQMRSGLYDFLQTDASINPGNSGGPLLNLHGEAVGINTAVNAAAQGIGFAIPVNMVKSMLPSLRKDGRVVRSWLGVGIQRISPELAKSFGLERPRGALVRQVVPDGPSAAAGLQPGDVITHFDGKAIVEANELPLLAADAGVGRAVEVKVVREGKQMTVSLSLGEHPDSVHARDEPAPLETPAGPSKASATLGLKIVTLDPADRERLKLGDDVAGARVVDVELGSRAFESGLMADDILVKANGATVSDAKAFAEVAKATRAGDVIRVIVLRKDSTIFVALVKP